MEISWKRQSVKLEESAATKMSVATIDNHEYRYAGDEKGRVIVAIIDNELVISLVPTELSEEHLKTVLGLTLPDQNIAQSGSLKNVADKYEFEDYFVGYIDMQQFASVFLDDQSGVNAELLSMLEFEGTQISDVCKSEMRSIAGVMPRIVAGYTDVSTEKISSKAVFELRDDLAAGVATMTGPVPGLGSDQGGIFSLGMSTDLMAAREFYSGRLDAMEAEPYECEDLAEFQYGVAAGREMLNQPLPPIVYGFKGFLAVVEDIEGLDFTKRNSTDFYRHASACFDGQCRRPDCDGCNVQPGAGLIEYRTKWRARQSRNGPARRDGTNRLCRDDR